MGLKISAELSHLCSLDDITKHAISLESKGFYRVWVPDTLVSQWDAWLAAAIIAHYTEKLKIGLGVTNPYTRHPVVVAQMASTLQLYSKDRLSLSIGKGIPRFLEKAGIDPHPSAVEECVIILKALIKGEKAVFNGDAFQIDNIRLRTLPLKKKLPVYLAAMGPDSWDAAARVADGVATIWNDKAASLRRKAIAGRSLFTAALVPFSLSDDSFFPQKAGSLEELRERVEAVKNAGFDEVILAYRDMNDMDTAAILIGEFI